VTWPTVEEVRNMTIAVIALSLAIGLILGAVDFGLLNLFTLLSNSH
ncbi:MAG: preprotein translocase subunit SecE, partial [Ktedonobacteraceae bacterium]|nr:preprotein translocase subunit SecE [Ktedonobacteraceae bacterium]